MTTPMQQPIVSIITASYNGMPYLPECVASVRSLLFAPRTDWTWEHIVVDDASTDDTSAWIDENGHPSLSYIRLEQNVGASAARNIGIRRARGTYVFVLDSDDVITQRGLYHLIAYLERTPEARYTYGDFLRMGANREYMLEQDYFGWPHTTGAEILQSIFRGEHFMQHSMLFSRDLLMHIGGYHANLRMAEDLDLVIRLVLAGHLPHYLPLVTHLHRFHANNASNGHDGKRHIEHLRTLFQLYRDKLSKHHVEAP
jgi:glycosyltransferase involved in cell wall biosynthesis